MNGYIVIDTYRCIGCGTCQAACSEGHQKAGLQAAPRLSLVLASDVSAAVTCHHCDGAPCMQVCPVRAITNENGSIHVNEQTCVGCKMCAIVCPFGAIHPSGTSIAGVAGMKYDTPTFPSSRSELLQWEAGVATRAVKCDLCSFDPEGPHCVKACTTNALSYVDEATVKSTLRKERAIAADASDQYAHDLTRMGVRR